MVSYHQNCPDLSYTVRKNCSSDRQKLLKFEAEGQEFAKILSSLEQFLFMFAYLGPIMFPPLGMST